MQPIVPWMARRYAEVFDDHELGHCVIVALA